MRQAGSMGTRQDEEQEPSGRRQYPTKGVEDSAEGRKLCVSLFFKERLVSKIGPMKAPRYLGMKNFMAACLA